MRHTTGLQFVKNEQPSDFFAVRRPLLIGNELTIPQHIHSGTKIKFYMPVVSWGANTL